jgi:hypothetical protein
MSTKDTGGRKIRCEKEALYNKIRKVFNQLDYWTMERRDYKNIWHLELKKGENNLKVFPVSLNLQMTLQTMVFILVVHILLFSD